MEMIGLIGLGTVGGQVARNMHAAGHALTVYDIFEDAVRPHVQAGARRAGSPADVARQCRVVFTSLPGPREVEEVALGRDGLLEGVHQGSVYVDLSSSSPDLIRLVESRFRSHGAEVMDAPLILGKGGIANRSAEVLASGSRETYAAMKPFFDTFGDRVVYTGELGTGTVIKLAHNLVRRGIGLAIGEGMVFGAKMGVNPELLWDCMRWGLEVQLHQLTKSFSETIFKGDYDAPATFDMALSRKDVGLATALGREHDVPMPIAALVEQTMIAAIARGWSHRSTAAALFRLQEEAAGLEVRKRTQT